MPRIARSGLILALLTLVAGPVSVCAEGTRYDLELWVRFAPGKIALQPGSTKSPIDSVWFAHPSLDSSIRFVATDTISYAVPKAVLREGAWGLPGPRGVAKPNYDDLMILHYETEQARGLAFEALQSDTSVVWMWKPKPYQLTACPIEGHLDQQWALGVGSCEGGGGGVAPGNIGARLAWDYSTGSADIKVAVIDVGVEGSHPDFQLPGSGSRIQGDWSTDGPHGTQMAGIIGATTNNGVGIAGMDWNCQVISWNAAASANEIDPSEAIEAIIEAVDAGTSVINNSYAHEDDDHWCSFFTMGDCVTEMSNAIGYAHANDVVVVAGMGNENSAATYYPAAHPAVIAVGASTGNNERWLMSNRGPHIDILAPGQNIYSLTTGGGYDFTGGTSAATAFVSGSASLLRAYRPDFSADDVKRILELSARDLGDPGFDEENGHGVLDIWAAFRLLDRPNHVELHRNIDVTTYEVSGYFSRAFHIPDGTGVYIVKRHELRADVPLDQTYFGTPIVWGSGSTTRGYSNDAPNWALGHTDTVPGTLTSNSVTLRTYVYEMWDLNGNEVGWRPCPPWEAFASLTVLGEVELAPTAVYVDYDTATSSASVVVAEQPNPSVEEICFHVKEGAEPWDTNAVVVPYNQLGIVVENLEEGSQEYSFAANMQTVNQAAPWGPIAAVFTRPNKPENVQAGLVEHLILASAGAVSDGKNLNPGVSAAGANSAVPRVGTEVEVTWEPPLNQVNAVDHYEIKAWRYGEWHNEYPCEFTHCCPCKTYEVFSDTFRALSKTICLDLKDHLYEISVFAIGRDGQASRPGNPVLITTGPEDWCNPCDPLYDQHCVPPADYKTSIPGAFSLSQNCPNPFNAATTIEFALAEGGLVVLDVYNILGQQVVRLVEENRPMGLHTVEWNGTDFQGRSVPSGIYVYRLSSQDFTATKKLILLK